jgi:hypothetical protein
MAMFFSTISVNSERISKGKENYCIHRLCNGHVRGILEDSLDGITLLVIIGPC